MKIIFYWDDSDQKPNLTLKMCIWAYILQPLTCVRWIVKIILVNKTIQTLNFDFFIVNFKSLRRI